MNHKCCLRFNDVEYLLFKLFLAKYSRLISKYIKKKEWMADYILDINKRGQKSMSRGETEYWE